jgi:hypothetical protein
MLPQPHIKHFTRITIMRVIKFFSVVALIALGFASSAQAVLTPNLLTDPGFNTPLTNPLISYTNVLGPPYSLNVWGDENSAVVGPQFGVTPLEGNGMLRMDDDGLVVTQIFQHVNVAGFATDIDAGNASAMLSANFTTGGGVVGSVAAMYIRYFTAGNAFLGTSAFVTPALDGNPVSWQAHSVPWSTIPAGTRILEAQLAFVNSTLPPNMAGYADLADLRLRTVPEPGTCLLALSSLASLLMRRGSIR